MPWPILESFFNMPVFALVLFRLAGLFLAAPLFASSLIPLRMRAMLAAAIAMLLYPLVKHQAPANLSLALALVGGIGEMMIGLTIGLGLALLVSGVEAAGLIVGQQSALSLGEVLNPTLEEQSSLPAQIYGMSFLILFLLAGGHRAALAAVMDTFTAVPLLTYRIQESMLLLFSETLTATLVLGIRLAGPIVLALFLTETGLAILSRTVPQLNILTVGFSLRVLLAHAVTAAALATATQPLLDGIWDTMDRIRAAFELGPSDIGLVT